MRGIVRRKWSKSMLELQALRLMPWTSVRPVDVAAWPAPGRVRLVRAQETDAVLGFVHAVREPAWLGCGPGRLEVCETLDASLLMSIEHGWFAFGHWQVMDAERCRVGGIVGRHLLDEQGGRFATLLQEGAAVSAIRDRLGKVLARLETAADGGALLRFAEDLGTNPFLRMLLLAACILSPTRAQGR